MDTIADLEDGFPITPYSVELSVPFSNLRSFRPSILSLHLFRLVEVVPGFGRVEGHPGPS